MSNPVAAYIAHMQIIYRVHADLREDTQYGSCSCKKCGEVFTSEKAKELHHITLFEEHPCFVAEVKRFKDESTARYKEKHKLKEE